MRSRRGRRPNAPALEIVAEVDTGRIRKTGVAAGSWVGKAGVVEAPFF
jgi:hypothetical protein